MFGPSIALPTTNTGNEAQPPKRLETSFVVGKHIFQVTFVAEDVVLQFDARIQLKMEEFHTLLQTLDGLSGTMQPPAPSLSEQFGSSIQELGKNLRKGADPDGDAPWKKSLEEPK